MDKDKDRQLAVLNRRVEQLELEQRVDRLERLGWHPPREVCASRTTASVVGGVGD